MRDGFHHNVFDDLDECARPNYDKYHNKDKRPTDADFHDTGDFKRDDAADYGIYEMNDLVEAKRVVKKIDADGFLCCDNMAGK